MAPNTKNPCPSEYGTHPCEQTEGHTGLHTNGWHAWTPLEENASPHTAEENTMNTPTPENRCTDIHGFFRCTEEGGHHGKHQSGRPGGPFHCTWPNTNKTISKCTSTFLGTHHCHLQPGHTNWHEDAHTVWNNEESDTIEEEVPRCTSRFHDQQCRKSKGHPGQHHNRVFTWIDHPLEDGPIDTSNLSPNGARAKAGLPTYRAEEDEHGVYPAPTEEEAPGYLILYAAPNPHRCPKPLLRDTNTGTIIRCNTCKKIWKLERSPQSVLNRRWIEIKRQTGDNK